MRIPVAFFTAVTLFVMSGSTCKAQLGGLSPDFIENLTDTQVVSLLGDVLVKNPQILHELEPVVFALGPLLDEFSAPKLKPDIANIILPWFLNNLPAWLQNKHFLLGIDKIVQQMDAVNTTDLVTMALNVMKQGKSPPYNDFMKGVLARTDFVTALQNFLMDEVGNITNIINLNPEIASNMLPWLIQNMADFFQHDGPKLLQVFIQELNSVNITDLLSADKATAIAGILDRINYSRLLSGLYNLTSVQDVVHLALHAGYKIIGLDPSLGDKLLPTLLNGISDIVTLTVRQIDNINLTEIAGLYHKNITSTELLQSLDYLDIIKSTFLPKIGDLISKYLKENALSILRMFSEELSVTERKNVFFFLFHEPTLPNLLQKFDWGDFLTKFLERFGKPVFNIVGLNPTIGKALAPVIAKDIPNLLKISIQELNKVNVTLVEKSSSPFLVILQELDIQNIIHEFAKQKGLAMDKIMGLNTGVVLALLDLTSGPAINFLKSEAYGILQIVVDEIQKVNTSGLNPSDMDTYVSGLINRLPWSNILAVIIGKEKDLVFPLLNLTPFQELNEESIAHVFQPAIQAMPVILKVLSDSFSGANFTSLPVNASVLDVLRQMSLHTIWHDVVMMAFPPESASQKLSSGIPSHFQTSPTCGPDSRDFLLNIFSQTWATQMLDAYGKPPAGLLRGGLHWMGSYDQCLAIEGSVVDNNVTRDIGGRYCRVAFDLPKSLLYLLVPSLENQNLYGMKTTLTFGICLPDSCHSGDIEEFFNQGLISLLNISPLSVYCNESLDLPEDENALLVLSIVAAIVLLVAIASILHLCKWSRSLSEDVRRQNKYESQDYTNPGYDAYSEADTETGSKATTTTSFSNGSLPSDANEFTKLKNGAVSSTTQPTKNVVPEDDDLFINKTPGIVQRITLSFSAIRNIGEVMSHRRDTNAIHCIHGLRFLSMTWIMLGNTYIYSILPITDSPLAADLLNALDIMKRFTFQAVMGAHYGIDTFLLISGCLVTYRLLSKFEKFEKFKWKTLIGFFFDRYIRLTPAYMLVMVIFVYWYRYLGTGPSWPGPIAVAEECRTNWWHHLLYINNLVNVNGKDPFHQCMTWGWFLAVLMQFYLITPVLILFATFSYRLAGVILFILTAAGITAAGLKEFDYGGDLLSMVEDQGAYWNNVFATPWCRVASYSIGMMLGLAILKYRSKKLPLWAAIIGWICSITIGFFVVYISYTKYTPELEDWNRNMEASYEALGRPLWSLCVAWVVYACYTGRGGLINSFLSWRGFLPLSRLTFGVYLVNPIWIVFFVYRNRQLIYLYNDFGVAYLFIGHIVASYAIAILVAVLFEKPFWNLARAIFKNK